MLTIQLFGDPQLFQDGHPLLIHRRKSRALLYYLASHPKPLKREALLSFFWPDLPRPSALQTLRTTLHGLRKSLGQSLVVAEDSLCLTSDTQIDVLTFEKQLTPPVQDIQSLQTALGLYRGEFLNHFSLPDSQSFEAWLTVERQHFRRLALRGFIALSNLQEAGGDLAAALDTLDRALALDPLQEDLQRETIRLSFRLGDRPAAIRRYDLFRRLLDEEMGVPPMLETRQLYDQIISDKLPAESLTAPKTRRAPLSPLQDEGSSGPLPFTGRSAELNRLGEIIASHELAFIEGEPGIGKTRLAQEFIRKIGALALTGVARELEMSLPYQPVIEALRSLPARSDWPALVAGVRSSISPIWMTEVARLLPELGGALSLPLAPTAAATESRLWEGLHQFLVGLSGSQPVVLFLDDLHWADASTLALLGYLVRQAPAGPIHYLAASRPVAPRSSLTALLTSLTREMRIARLPLARLDNADVGAIASQLSPSQSSPLADWLMRHSEGNPYVLAEFVRYARERGLLQPDGHLDEEKLSSGADIPQSVYSLIQARLGRLSEAARRILDAAVSAGPEFEFEVVMHAAALSEAAALDAIDELLNARLILPRDGLSFSFDHPLISEVAYREVGELRHRRLHRMVAEAMEALYREPAGPRAGLVAYHFNEGNAPGRAAPYALQAGQSAARLAAWNEAIGFYRQALDAGTLEESLHGQALLALGKAHLHAGEAAQAAEVFASFLSHVSPESAEADEARLLLGRSFLSQARFSEVVRLAQRVLKGARPEYTAAAQFLWGTALSLEGADLEEAARHLEAAESLAQEEETGSLTDLARSRFELGSVAAQQGDLKKAVDLYHQALETACREDALEVLEWCVLAYNNLAYHLHLLGDPEAADYAHKGLALAQEKGLIGQQPYLFSTLGEIALAQDDLNEAERRFTEGLALSRRLGVRERVAGLTANLGLLALRQGQTSLAIHRLSSSLAQAESLGTGHLAAQIRLWLAPYLPPEEAAAALAAVRAYAGSTGRQRLLAEAEAISSSLKVE